MTPLKRPLAAVGAAALLAFSLSACGGAPTDASKEDYCKAVNSETGSKEFTEALSDKDYDKIVDLLKKQVDKIEEVGTPDDISDDEREGFEIQIDAAKDLSADDLKKAFEENSDKNPFEADLSSDEKKKVEAYNEYESKTCSESDSGSDSSSAPSTPTELPTDLSEMPTELPSDLPTDLSDLPTEIPSELESLLSDLPTAAS